MMGRGRRSVSIAAFAWPVVALCLAALGAAYYASSQRSEGDRMLAGRAVLAVARSAETDPMGDEAESPAAGGPSAASVVELLARSESGARLPETSRRLHRALLMTEVMRAVMASKEASPAMSPTPSDARLGALIPRADELLVREPSLRSAFALDATGQARLRAPKDEAVRVLRAAIALELDAAERSRVVASAVRDR